MTMELVDKIKFWENGAKEDFAFAKKLYTDKNYLWSLFIIQLALEKALKARALEKTQKEPPKIHDLYKIALMAGIELKDDDIDNLRIVTSFNIEARYSDYKENLRKTATKDYTAKFIEIGKEYLQWFLKKS